MATDHFEKAELEKIDNMKTEDDIVIEDSADWRAAEKSLLRKIDMTLLPLVWLLYLFNYLDRNNIS